MSEAIAPETLSFRMSADVNSLSVAIRLQAVTF